MYAEPSVVAKAAKEFEDTEKMMEAAEKLFGPYRWGRYDVLVLPPSFPFGGMENPRLTFATPTILAGDKSLVSLVAHELAHSWSGNLVTNATWSDFWLNEGFTVYIERRIQEEVYGTARAEMEAVLGRRELAEEMARLGPKDQILHVDLAGRDPDDGMTQVPYEKGALMLLQIENTFGRERFDKYLRVLRSFCVSEYYDGAGVGVSAGEFAGAIAGVGGKDSGGAVGESAGVAGGGAGSKIGRVPSGGGAGGGLGVGECACGAVEDGGVEFAGVAAFSEGDAGEAERQADGGAGWGVSFYAEREQ